MVVGALVVVVEAVLVVDSGNFFLDTVVVGATYVVVVVVGLVVGTVAGTVTDSPVVVVVVPATVVVTEVVGGTELVAGAAKLKHKMDISTSL